MNGISQVKTGTKGLMGNNNHIIISIELPQGCCFDILLGYKDSF